MACWGLVAWPWRPPEGGRLGACGPPQTRTLGQELLREAHEIAVNRGEYRDRRKDYDASFTYRDQKIVQLDRAKERARKITVEMLANSSRTPLLKGGSAPHLKAKGKRRDSKPNFIPTEAWAEMTRQAEQEAEAEMMGVDDV